MEKGRKTKLIAMDFVANALIVAGFCLYLHFSPRYGYGAIQMQSSLLYVWSFIAALELLAILALRYAGGLRAVMDERARKLLIEIVILNLLLLTLVCIGAFYLLGYLGSTSS